jgi:hypothetical protein
MTRRTVLALVAGCLGAAVPAVASAVLLWTLVATPLTSTVNVSTTFTLTATNLLMVDDLGCLEVDLPASFVIESLGSATASNGDPWSSSRSGNEVIVRSETGGGRLELTESVQFTIRAHGTVAGIYEWANHAHRQQDCSSADQPGVPLAVTVLPAILPTPTPTPVPTPNPTAAPTSTPRPTLAPTATPIPVPSLPLPSIGLPGLTPTPDPTRSATPTATPESSPSPAARDRSGADGTGAPPPGGGAAGGSGQTFQLARFADDTNGDAGVDVGVELFGLLGTDYVWFVPAASVALPGLLVILFVGLQGLGALAWIPFVRRMEDEQQTRGRLGT